MSLGPPAGHTAVVDTAGSSTQARRLAERRASLLADGVVAQATPDAGALVTVSHDGTTVAPVFQFGPDGTPRPELRPLIATLTRAGVHGWQLWTWLTAPSTPAAASASASSRTGRATPVARPW